jgi:hypothetical protein
MSSPVVVVYRESITIFREDGTVQSYGTDRPVSELLRRLRMQDGPAAAATRSPELARLVKLLDGRVEAIELG